MIEYANKDTHERTLPLGMIITPEDIYRYFILDEVLKLPHSRLAKNQAQ